MLRDQTKADYLEHVLGMTSITNQMIVLLEQIAMRFDNLTEDCGEIITTEKGYLRKCQEGLQDALSQ
jgi:hypothetical protein